MLVPAPFSPAGIWGANSGAIAGTGETSQVDSGENGVRSTNYRAALAIDDFATNFIQTGRRINRFFENIVISNIVDSGFLLPPSSFIHQYRAKKTGDEVKGNAGGYTYATSGVAGGVDRSNIISTLESNGLNPIPGFSSVSDSGGQVQQPAVSTESTNLILKQNPVAHTVTLNMGVSAIPETSPVLEKENTATAEVISTVVAGMINSFPDPENQRGNNKNPWKWRLPKLTVSSTSDWITIIQGVADALKQDGNNNKGECSPCCPTLPQRCDELSLSDNGKALNSLPGENNLSSKLDGIRIDVNRLAERFDNDGNSQSTYVQSPYKWPDQSTLSSTLGEIRGNVQRLKDYFVKDTPEQPANNETSKIESALTTANTTLNKIDNNVNRLAERFTHEASDKTGNNKTQQPDWSLMLLGNIAIDLKRMADQYVGSNLNHSSNGPVFQNIRDTVWLNNTLNGIQDNTTRVVSLLPVQPNNYFNQTNNFTISGAQEPHAVAEAVRVSVPMMSDFSQANQILQARAI